MIRGSQALKLKLGFTIIEVMIVLAVSSMLLFAAVTAISGQQRKTEFSQAIRDIESQINDIINDVGNGFYPSTNDFRCTANNSGPTLFNGTSAQGTNNQCVFIGRAIQFGVSGTSSEGFNIYTIVGSRQYTTSSGPREVIDLDEAQPTAIAPGTSDDSDFPDASESKDLSYGLKVRSMGYNSSSVKTNIGAVAFISTPAELADNKIKSGAQVVNLMSISGSSLNQDPKNTVDAINNIDKNSPVNPDGGVTICIDSGGTDQNGVITIGSNGRQLSTKLTINTGKCS